MTSREAVSERPSVCFGADAVFDCPDGRQGDTGQTERRLEASDIMNDELRNGTCRAEYYF